MMRCLTGSLLIVVLWQAAITSIPAAGADAFRAGAAVSDITPDVGVSLNGPISKPGPVKGVHDPLHARALVLDDGQTRLAIVVLDLTMVERAVCDLMKESIQSRAGIDPQHVLISAVHTHAAPRVRAGRAGPLDDRYYDFLIRQTAESVRKAVANLAPAQVAFGTFDEPRYVKCRRSLCEPGTVGANPFGETGERVKSVSGKGGKILRPAGPVDPQVSVLAVRHGDGSPLAVLGNYSVHYCGGYARGLVSADYFGYYAKRLEERLPAKQGHPAMVGIMANGTSGNTGSIATGGKRYQPFEWMQKSGSALADRTIELLNDLEYRADVTLAMLEEDLELKIRRPDAQRLQWAKGVLSHPNERQIHPWTKIYAQQAMLLSRYPATRPVKIQAIRVGDVAIASVACEVFAETGLAIKQGSPFSKTFTMSLANGSEGYLPTPQQHEWGGYETWPATSSCLEVQAEPAIRNGVLELLRELAGRE